MSVGGLQLWEILVVLAIALVIFGPKRLPEMGRSLGRGMREFKDSITGKDEDEARERERERERERVTLPPPPTERETDTVA